MQVIALLNCKLADLLPYAKALTKCLLFVLQGRGSINSATGPSRDHTTFLSGAPSRGYAYIDSGYPRRPGDRAKLVSPGMIATGTTILSVDKLKQ